MEKNIKAQGMISGFRLASGYTSSKEVADILGISKPTYLKYEKQPWKMSFETFEKLVELYGDEFAQYFIEHKLYKKN